MCHRRTPVINPPRLALLLTPFIAMGALAVVAGPSLAAGCLVIAVALTAAAAGLKYAQGDRQPPPRQAPRVAFTDPPNPPLPAPPSAVDQREQRILRLVNDRRTPVEERAAGLRALRRIDARRQR